jgi:hypothetical protein
MHPSVTIFGAVVHTADGEPRSGAFAARDYDDALSQAVDACKRELGVGSRVKGIFPIRTAVCKTLSDEEFLALLDKLALLHKCLCWERNLEALTQSTIAICREIHKYILDTKGAL